MPRLSMAARTERTSRGPVDHPPGAELQEVHDVVVDPAQGGLDPVALEALPELANDVDGAQLDHGRRVRVVVVLG